MTAATAADKKKKKEKAQPATEQTATMKTPADSLSYAAGMAYTMGLQQYLKQQFDLDTAQMGEFIRGYRETIVTAGDPAKTAYNAGAQVATMVVKQMLPRAVSEFKGTADSINVEIFHDGFIAGVQGDTTTYKVGEASQLFSDKVKQEEARKTEAFKKRNADWIAANASVEGVKTTASGLQYKIIKTGSGALPTKDDKVVVKYEGRDIDGNVFDSSLKRNPQTATFGVGQVIKGWTEALMMMPVGSKWQIFIPQQLAYGSRQTGPIKPYSTLIFDVELVDIQKPEPKKTGSTEKSATAATQKTSKADAEKARK